MRHMGASRRLRVVALVAALALSAACGSSSDGTSGSKGGKPTHSKPTPVQPGPHFPQKGHPLKLGQVAQIGAGGKGAAALIKVTKPRVSRSRLSSSYGDNPVHGYFVNFPIKILNIGSKPLLVDRLDFYVKTPGLGKVNTNQGAAPFSGAPEQLDTTEVDPGKGLSGHLAFDVSTPHGKFIYGPGGKVSVAWRY
jgi:hypothetical protein